MRHAVGLRSSYARTHEAEYSDRNDIIEIRTESYGGHRTTKVFKSLMAHYAPEFAAVVSILGIKSIELIDVSFITVRIFNYWMRSSWEFDLSQNKLPTEIGAEAPIWDLLGSDLYINFLSPLLTSPVPHRSVWEIVDFFIFGETYNIPRLGQDAVDWLAKRFRFQDLEPSHARMIQWAYAHTQAGSPLRKLLVDAFFIWAHRDDQDWMLKISQMPKEFLVDLVQQRLPRRLR
jgi:hypothetical protein